MLIYNTLTNKKELFEPIEEKKVRMYVCGPTVYDRIHIGNARTAMVFDAFRRYLEYRGYEVVYVQNITDVEDKIINRMKEENRSFEEITKEYTDSYFEDANALGIKEPTYAPKTTEYINDIVEFITDLISNGHAYQVDGDVYFRVKSYLKYGQLSNRSVDDMLVGARIEVNEKKEDPLDFALWKSAKPGEPKWNSPWGEGRPGWHIECSTMANVLLGDTFDIHCGGTDLIFPHHENERAQSESRTGKTMAKYWMHSGMVEFGGDKMSKSIGNVKYIEQLLTLYDRPTIRFYLLSKHYRSPIGFSVARLEESKSAVRRIYNAISMVEEQLPQEVKEGRYDEEENEQFNAEIEKYLDDDFNTPAAFGVIFDMVKNTNSLLSSSIGNAEKMRLLAYYHLIKKWGKLFDIFQGSKQVDNRLAVKLIELLLDIRQKARDEENWKIADEIRNGLNFIGIAIMDTPNGTKWRYST